METNIKERQIKGISAMARMHQSLGAFSDLEDISKIVGQELVNLLDCSGCAVLLIAENKIRTLAHYGAPQISFNDEYIEETPAIRYLMSRKQSIHSGDVAAGSAIGPVAAGNTFRSWAYSPALVNDQVQGIIYVNSPHDNAFDEEDLRFIALIAKVFAIAIERSSLQAQVRESLAKNGLTRCFNREKFNDDFEAEIARAQRFQRTFSLLTAELKGIAKSHQVRGTKEHEELLGRFSTILAHNVRCVDRVYYLEKEKFVILLPETVKENAVVVAQRLQRIITEQVIEGGKRASYMNSELNVRVEVASYPWDGSTKKELLRRCRFCTLPSSTTSFE